jgi:hypothetical protein
MFFMVLLSLCWQTPNLSELFSGRRRQRKLQRGRQQVRRQSKKNSLSREIIVLMLEPLHHLRTDVSVRLEFTVFKLRKN